MMRDDWVECSLLDACDIYDNLRKPINSKERANRIKGKDTSELFPYYGATGQVGYIDDYLTSGNFVLVGEDAAPFFDLSKDVAYKISGKTWVNNHAHILKSKFNDDFLKHYLNNFNYHGFVSGTTRLKLTQGRLKTIPFKVAPLPEQRAIVAKIEELFSSLDNGISDLNKASAQLKIYRQAVLKKAFTGELSKAWRAKQANLPTASELLQQIQTERQSHHQQQLTKWQEAVQLWEDGGKEGRKPTKPRALKEFPSLTEEELAMLPTLPLEWQWVKTGSICQKIQIGPFGTQLHKHEYVEMGVPIINPKHIRNQTINPQIFISKSKAQSLSQYFLKTNDIIVGRRGEMGRTAPITIKENNWFCGTGSLFLRLGAMLCGKFYSLLISERRTVNYLNKMGSGTTMTNVNATIVNNLPLPLLSLPEQQQIIQEIESRLSVCDNIEIGRASCRERVFRAV